MFNLLRFTFFILQHLAQKKTSALKRARALKMLQDRSTTPEALAFKKTRALQKTSEPSGAVQPRRAL
jgi:hypothetical protein